MVAVVLASTHFASIAPVLLLPIVAAIVGLPQTADVRRRVDPRVTRLAVALLLAVVLATAAHASAELVIMDECHGLGPGDVMYWLMGCPWRPYYPF